MNASRRQAPVSSASSETAPEDQGGQGLRGLRRLQSTLTVAGFASAVLGFAFVLYVVASELLGHTAAPWLYWPFMVFLPLAMLLLIGAVLTGVVLRRHN